MHVGVFLGDIQPDAGGGFTFTHDLVNAFFAEAVNSIHSFTLICPPDYANAVSVRPLPANICVAPLNVREPLARALVALRHYVHLFPVLYRAPTRLDRLCAARAIQLVWFVGGFHDSPDTPYIATVWDVQHLTHPWFPEVSARGQWDRREHFLSRHLRRASHVITGTSVGRDELVRFYGLQDSKISLLPHPTPAFALAADPAPVGKAARPYFLYPAQFWAHKNHANLLEGYRRLIDELPDAPGLVLVGSDKGNRAFVDDQIARLDLQGRVRVLGFVPTEDLISLYRGATALAYASFSGPENLPPLEAFALGCSVVASDVPGAREQLGEAALYFDPASAESIARALGSVLTDDDGRRARVALGRARALAWTGAHYVQGVLGIIDRMSGQRRTWA